MSTHETLANSPVVILAGGLGTRCARSSRIAPRHLPLSASSRSWRSRSVCFETRGRGGSCSASAIAPSRSRTCWETGGD